MVTVAVDTKKLIARDLDLGRSVSSIARKHGVCRETVTRIRTRIAKAKEEGRTPKLAPARSGRKPALAPHLESRLHDSARHQQRQTQRSTGRPQPITAAQVMAIAQASHIRLSPSQAKRLCAKWRQLEKGGRPAPTETGATPDRTDLILTWELLAWTLGDMAQVADLARDIARVTSFVQDLFTAQGSANTMYRRVQHLRKPQSDFFRRCRELRRQLHLAPPSDPKDRTPIDLPGFWSIRFLPARDVDRGEQLHPLDGERPAARILAMAMDLRTGAFLMEMYPATRKDDDLALDQQDLVRLICRVQGDILERGGAIHLPQPTPTSQGLDAVHASLAEIAKAFDVQSHFDMPTSWPGDDQVVIAASGQRLSGITVERDWRDKLPICFIADGKSLSFQPTPPAKDKGGQRMKLYPALAKK